MFPTTKRKTQRVLPRVLFLLALLIALAGIGQSQTASPCTGSQLSIKDEHGDNAMGGQTGEYYSFKNGSQSPCTLKGAPTIALLDGAGHKIPGQKAMQSEDTAETVTLQPGGKAFFSIDYRSCEVMRKAGYRERCVTAAELQIEAPETKHKFVLKRSINPEKLQLRVSPVMSKDPTAP
jgi:hypothetical protein